MKYGASLKVYYNNADRRVDGKPRPTIEIKLSEEDSTEIAILGGEEAMMLGAKLIEYGLKVHEWEKQKKGKPQNP